MIKWIIEADRRCSIVIMLYLFFALFWLGNGFDKFFNGDFRHDTNPNVAKFVVLDPATDEVIGRVQKFRVHGFFGSNRDQAFKEYFNQLGLSFETSQVFLYGISIVEIILGFTFLYIFLRSIFQWNHLYDKATLFGTRTLHRLSFKISTFLFIGFVTFDILVGDRVEHWEHSAFFTLMLISYYLFIQQHKIEREEDREITVAGWNGTERRGYYKGPERRKDTNEIFQGNDRRAKARGRRSEDKSGKPYQPRRVQEYVTDNDRRRGSEERREGPRKKKVEEPRIIY